MEPCRDIFALHLGEEGEVVGSGLHKLPGQLTDQKGLNKADRPLNN